ncbi:MAG: hypothetical protein KBA50_00620 [Sedimentibacter sp.]|nr:hypothetical protein [Sedimentibacter sp.]
MMPNKNVKREFDPDDTKIFSKESIAGLKIEGRFLIWWNVWTLGLQ